MKKCRRSRAKLALGAKFLQGNRTLTRVLPSREAISRVVMTGTATTAAAKTPRSDAGIFRVRIFAREIPPSEIRPGQVKGEYKTAPPVTM